MRCPRCGKDKFSLDGICLACNYQVKITETSPDLEFHKNETETDTFPEEGTSTDAAPMAEQDGIPEWQKELSQRLADIKLKKATADAPGEPPGKSALSDPPAPRTEVPGQPTHALTEHAGSIQVRSQNPKTLLPVKNAGAGVPKQKTIASLGPNVFAAGKAAATSDSRNIKDLIDSSVLMHPARSEESAPVFRPNSPVDEENKLILLSRSLAGLIDLIIVVLCTTVFIISVDYFSGIVILDIVSLVEYAGLFLMVFLLYSVFFLATAGQTVGMMITDLRVEGIQGSRPSIVQLFIRCAGFILSVIVLGTGLLWSLFDRKNMCFHDRLSNTSITRL